MAMTFEEYNQSVGLSPTADGTGWTSPSGRVAPSDTLKNNYTLYSQRETASANGLNPDLIVDPNKFYSKPGDTTAALMRAQYQDYQDRFTEHENALFGQTSYMNPNLANEEVNKAIGAGGYVQNINQVAQNNQRYGFQKYGIQQTQEALNAQNKRSNLNSSLAIVDAASRIRQRIQDRDRAIATGAASLVKPVISAAA